MATKIGIGAPLKALTLEQAKVKFIEAQADIKKLKEDNKILKDENNKLTEMLVAAQSTTPPAGGK